MTNLKPAQHFAVNDAANQPAVLQQSRYFNDDDQVLSANSAAEDQPVAEKKSVLFWLLPLGLLILLLLAGLQWFDWLQSSWQQHWFKGLLVSAVSTVFVVVISILGWREWQLWRRLQRNRQWQHSAQRIEQSVQFGEADSLCRNIMSSLEADSDIQQQWLLWQQAVTPNHDDQEKLVLFEQLVLTRLDQQAKQRINRAATDSALAVAISPFALADMLLVLWRSSRLLRELAQLYGGSVGQLRSLLMLKRLVAAIFWAGGSELALDMATDVLGSELTAKLSARAGQGVIAGLLVARIGLLAQQQLRPLPLAKAQRLNFAKLSAALLQRLQGKTAAN